MKKVTGWLMTAAVILGTTGNSMAGFGLVDCGCESACDTSCGACEPGCDLDCGLGCDGFTDCDGCDAFGCDARFGEFSNLLGLLRKSDHCFDDFISPMINFVHFEDPRTLTELRPIFLTQRVPNALGPGAIPAGGSVQLFAAQFRIALTDRLSLIAVKDGYIIDNTEGALDGLLNSGWADITAGLKYNLIRNTQTGSLLSAGFTYEIPMGSDGALQSVGDGQFHFFLSGGQRLLDGNAHYLTSLGYQLPVDNDVQTTTLNWNHHLDYRVTKRHYIFTELSWWHWVDDADNGAALGVAGLDLINLGASNVEGNNMVSQNVGLKYKPCGNFEAGVAYQFPLTEFEDILRDRWQFEMIFRY